MRARLNAFGNKYLLQSIFKYRRRYLRTVKRALRRVKHYQHRILRIGCRYKAYKRRYVFARGIAALLGKFFCRAGFARNLIACNMRRFAAALADNFSIIMRICPATSSVITRRTTFFCPWRKTRRRALQFYQ